MRRTSSHVGSAALRRLKARCELVSVVFCERIVPTSESSTHARRPQLPPPGPRSPLRSVRTRSITSGCSVASARWTARHSCSVGRA